MAFLVTRWERRDAASREALAQAAFEYCRAVRKDGATSSRFYWRSPDSIAMISEAPEMAVFDQPASPEAAAALFKLADLARPVDVDRWMDPAAGEAAYRAAGR